MVWKKYVAIGNGNRLVVKKEIRIAPKQLRALVLLLLLLPIVPSAILVPFMWDTLASSRQAEWDDFLISQQQVLALASRRLERDPASALGDGLAAGSGKVDPAVLARYFKATLDVSGTVRITDVGRGASAVEAIRSDGFEAVIARPLEGRFAGSAVEVQLGVDDLSSGGTDERRKTLVLTTGLLAAVGLTAAVAGFAVHRQLKREEMKSDFLATVSHELKTPVASMRLLLDTLRQGDVVDGAAVREYLDLMASENERLQGTLEKFLTYWRLEQKRESFFMDWVSPAEITRSALAAVIPGIEARAGKVKVNIRPLLCDIKADKEALITVVSSLLDNAVKYSPEAPEISVDVFQSGESVFFQVGDRGVGVPKDDRRRIFDRFYRVDQKLSRRGGGCGLGLSIAKFIVEAHRGKIGVLGRARETGSIFWIQIPLPSPMITRAVREQMA